MIFKEQGQDIILSSDQLTGYTKLGNELKVLTITSTKYKHIIY